MPQIAVVTGGNRGIGFEICRQLAKRGVKVVLTARDEVKGRAVSRQLQEEGLDIIFHTLDVDNETSIKQLAGWLDKTFASLDILVNNAGILIDRGITTLEPDISKIRQTMETNVYGALLVCRYLIPIMKKNNYGRIINTSSGAGSMSRITTEYPGYRISKAAVSVITVLLANELTGTNITVNAADPGPVHTDMNPRGSRTAEQAADTVVWLALEVSSTGKNFQDRKEIDW